MTDTKPKFINKKKKAIQIVYYLAKKISIFEVYYTFMERVSRFSAL